jgi:thiol peroxidase|tara:strand:+ start:789 stop:1289 length:501 start_codon:yes stop_codon:yes gene_type:complete
MTKVKLGDFEVTLNGELPQVGSQLPNFLLADSDLSNVNLEHFKGKKLVLNIFPSMNTPVCSAAAVRFNSLASTFENTVVLCISRDLAFGHKQFCINHDLNDIVFLSDMRNEDFANDYGVLHTNGKFQGLLARSVIVTDSDHNIIHTQLVDQTGHEPDYDKVVELFT